MAKPKVTEEQVLKAAAAMITFSDLNMTVADFFRNCMLALWEEEDGFSGKRPICDSGWSIGITEALVRAKVVKGEIDADNDLVYNSYDSKEVDEIIKAVINRFVIKHQ